MISGYREELLENYFNAKNIESAIEKKIYISIPAMRESLNVMSTIYVEKHNTEHLKLSIKIA